MNIRKNIDYTDMYAALDGAMKKDLSQVELYYQLGKAVCQRTEKGAAVAAASYLSKQYPDVQGFSPRNLRRMRDFYRTYGNHPSVLAAAMQVGWTQNVVIMEADLTMELRRWYLKAVKQFGWSKAELVEKIASNAHEKINLAVDGKNCNVGEQKMVVKCGMLGDNPHKKNGADTIRKLIWETEHRMILWKKSVRQCGDVFCWTFTKKLISTIRC